MSEILPINIESKPEATNAAGFELVGHKSGDFTRLKLFDAYGKLKPEFVNQNVTVNNNTYNLDPSQIVPSEALYNDDTLAGDILKRIDKTTGENVNYRETTKWHDGSTMDDSKIDGKFYIKENSKYYKLSVDSINVLSLKNDTDTDRTAFIKAFDFSDKIIIPKEGIIISEPTIIKNVQNKKLISDGYITFTDNGSLIFQSGNEPVIELPALIENIITTLNVAKFISAHGLSVGDVFGVHNQNNYSFSQHRPVYQDGQMFRVIEVISPTEVRFSTRAERVFDKDLVTPFKLSGGNIDVDGLKINPQGVNYNVLRFDGLIGQRIKNFNFKAGAKYSAILLFRCYDFIVDNTKSEVYSGDAYPLNIGNCQKGIIYGGTALYSNRHCIAMGGGAGLGCVPTSNVQVIGGIYENNPLYGIGALDTHGNCENISYHGVTASVLNCGGRNIAAYNSKFTGTTSDFPAGLNNGVVIDSRETVGGYLTLKNCILETAGKGVQNKFIDLECSRIMEDLEINIDNCELYHFGSDQNFEGSILMLSSSYFGTCEHNITYNIDELKVNKKVTNLALTAFHGTFNPAKNLTLNIFNRNGGIKFENGAALNVGLDADSHIVKVNAILSTEGVELRGDEDVMLNNCDKKTQVFSEELTAHRYLSFDNNAYMFSPGETFKIVRKNLSSNAFSLYVAGLTELAYNEWCEIMVKPPYFNRTFVVIAKGTN